MPPPKVAAVAVAAASGGGAQHPLPLRTPTMNRTTNGANNVYTTARRLTIPQPFRLSTPRRTAEADAAVAAQTPAPTRVSLVKMPAAPKRIAGAVPDFRRLHNRWAETFERGKMASRRSATVSQEFSFANREATTSRASMWALPTTSTAGRTPSSSARSLAESASRAPSMPPARGRRLFVDGIVPMAAGTPARSSGTLPSILASNSIDELGSPHSANFSVCIMPNAPPADAEAVSPRRQTTGARRPVSLGDATVRRRQTSSFDDRLGDYLVHREMAPGTTLASELAQLEGQESCVERNLAALKQRHFQEQQQLERLRQKRLEMLQTPHAKSRVAPLSAAASRARRQSFGGFALRQPMASDEEDEEDEEEAQNKQQPLEGKASSGEENAYLGKPLGPLFGRVAPTATPSKLLSMHSLSLKSPVRASPGRRTSLA